MTYGFLPKDTIGRSSLGLGLAFLLLIVLKITVGFPLMSFFIAGIGLAGFICAIISLVREKRLAFTLLLPILLGLLILAWTGAELLFPH